MQMLMGAVAAYGSQFPMLNPAVNKEWDTEGSRWQCFVKTLGGFPVICAQVYWGFVDGGKVRGMGEVWKGFGEDVEYGERFLRMVGLGGGEGHGGRLRRELGGVLEVLLVLHADHELNCSTATMRGLASSGVDVWSCVVGAVGAL